MDAWQRKRTRPAQITGRVVLRPPPQQEEETAWGKRPRFEESQRMPNLDEFFMMDWCALMEAEVERRIEERLSAPLFGEFSADETVFLNSARNSGNIEELVRDSDEETVIEVEHDPASAPSYVAGGGPVINEEYDPTSPSFDKTEFHLPETPPPSASTTKEKSPFRFPPENSMMEKSLKTRRKVPSPHMTVVFH